MGCTGKYIVPVVLWIVEKGKMLIMERWWYIADGGGKVELVICLRLPSSVLPLVWLILIVRLLKQATHLGMD